MFVNSLESIPVCSLSITKANKMSKSSYNTRRRSSLLNADCLCSKKKKVRQPLKCKKNVSCVNRSINKTPKKYESSCSDKIDMLHKTSERSSSGFNATLQHEDIIVADKNVSKRKSKRLQNAFDKKNCEDSQKIPLVSPDNTKRRSFYRNKLTSHCSRKSEREDKHCSDVATVVSVPVPYESETIRSSRSSMTLRSQQLSGKKSDVQLLTAPKRKSSCSVEINVSNKMPLQKSLETYRSSCSVEIDVLSKASETVSPKSTKITLRSSSVPNGILQSKDVIRDDKNISERKSKRQQNTSDKKNFDVPSIIPLESPNKTKRHSFYRNNLISQCNKKSQRQSTKDASLPKDKPNVQKTKHVQKPSKFVSSSQLLKKTPNVQKSKYIRKKSSKKFQERVRSKSFPENIPVDDLALLPYRTRKVKSEGFHLPGKNTLKRKRYIMDAMKRTDEDYEDDIFESKQAEFDYFKEILPDTSESEISCEMRTPKLGIQLTPLIRSKTPAYKDCFSPTEYALSRKVAEECLYRNKKRKSNSQVETPEMPEKKKLEFNEVLDDVCKVQKEVEKLAEDKSDNEDIYFSDFEI